MLIILAPSKTMDFTTKLPEYAKLEMPLFIEEAKIIADQLKNYSEDELAKLMNVSTAIADNVHMMYQNWDEKGKRPALWTYKGDVYKGMYADQLTREDAAWAQRHVLIMSGVYGMLRPFDATSSYRLEMKAKLPVDGAKDLYDFWGDKLSRYVADHTGGTVCVLSSDEYAKPVLRHLPKNIRVVTPVCYDNRPNGTVGTAPIYNKMMRGVIAHWMIKHRIETPEGLKDFTGHGYTYDPSRSTPDKPAFFREKMLPLQF